MTTTLQNSTRQRVHGPPRTGDEPRGTLDRPGDGAAAVPGSG
jgi:hypothetical protein